MTACLQLNVDKPMARHHYLRTAASASLKAGSVMGTKRPVALARCRLAGQGGGPAGLIDYGIRYRAGRPFSTSRAKGLVDELANAWTAKRRRMRWSPHEAHCVATVRATVLDGRLGSVMPTRFAA